MIFQRVNRTNAERVFVVFRANDANLGADDVAQLDLTAASVDGVFIVQPANSQGNAVVGIVDATIANGAYGLVQVYGYRSTSYINMTESSIPVGAALQPVLASPGLRFKTDVGLMEASGIAPSFIALETKVAAASSTATGTVKIFIRCM